MPASIRRCRIASTFEFSWAWGYLLEQDDELGPGGPNDAGLRLSAGDGEVLAGGVLVGGPVEALVLGAQLQDHAGLAQGGQGL